MSGAGKGGNNRKNRQRYSGRKEEVQRQDSNRPKEAQGWNSKKIGENFLADGKFGKSGLSLHDRPIWTAPKIPSDPIPSHNCEWCGKPIRDISSAFSDKNNGLPVHFDCVLERLNKTEALESHDLICYIGGGRFGIIHYNNPPDTIDFRIKKIFEWENKENRCEWRRSVSDHFSVT